MTTVELNLSRKVQRRASVSKTRASLLATLVSALKKHPKAGIPKLTMLITGSGYAATVNIPGRMKAQEWTEVVSSIREACILRFDPPWMIVDVAGDNAEHEPDGDDKEKTADRPVGSVNLDFPPDTFARLYGRDAQIRRTMDALILGRDTGWTKRKHTLLLGPPGCGKTELMLILSRAMGKEGEAWTWFDATSTTKAGAIEQLMQATVSPPILFVEEIEKTHESSLRWLLGLMDERGEVRRTNYRVGNQVKALKKCVVATCNNDQLLKAMDAGALYSRFANRVYCPEPSREVLEKILLREVKEVIQSDTDRDYEWVQRALEFGYDECGIRDPRELINMVLCGRDRLLDESYQADFKATISPTDRKAILT